MRLLHIAIIAATALVAQERTPQWLFEHGHFGEARAVAERQLAANPRDATALAWLARAQTLAGDLKGAAATAERAIAADPRYAGGHMALAEALGAEAVRAGVLRRLPLARRIRKALETAVAVEPTNVDALNGLVQYYLQAPGIVGGGDDKADATALRITGIDAARGLVTQGEIAAYRGQPDRVEALYRKAVEANPRSTHARIALANFYAARPGRHGEAEAQAASLLALDPALMTPYRVLAVVFARAGRWNELDAILARADSQHPSNLLAWLAAGETLLATGADLPRAERCLRRYLAQPPELGMPSHAVARWRLGLVLEKAGRRGEAEAALREALRMDPELEQAKKDLKRVSGEP